jgi:hypothetical protein
MAGTFEKLKRIKARLQGGAEAAVAVPFELNCECGGTVAGMRRKSWIESECPECCQTLFVLPANVYPATKRVPSEVLGGSFSDRLQAVVSELLPAKKKPSKKAAEKAVVAATAAPAVAVKRKPWFSLPHIDIVGFLKRTFTPFRLLMMAMTVVVGLTVYWMTYQRAVENAQQTWLKSPEEIEGLLNDSKMVELQQTLQTAVQAADLLQRDDAESRRIRNMLGETMAINSIASSELLTAFHNAYNDEGVLQETAASEIEDVCRSGTFLFDSYLTARPGLSDVYLAEFPATPGRHPIELVIPLPAVGDFLEAFEDGRAIFTVTIDQVAAPTIGTYEPWVLHVESTSFVLLTSLPHCERIGLTKDIDPTLEGILQRQRDFVEGSATWYARAETAVVEKPDSDDESP